MVDRLDQAGIAPLIVVVGDAEAEVVQALEGSGAVTVRNPSPVDGLSSSLRLGVEALPEDTGAFVVALGDQPLVSIEVVRTLVSVWAASNAAAVVPVYRNGRGNPVVFDATMRRRLGALAGDAGARELLDDASDHRVVRVAVDLDAPRDVDTPADLHHLAG